MLIVSRLHGIRKRYGANEKLDNEDNIYIYIYSLSNEIMDLMIVRYY